MEGRNRVTTMFSWMDCSFRVTECSVHALHRAIRLPWHQYGTTCLFIRAGLSNTSKQGPAPNALFLLLFISVRALCFHLPTFLLPLPVPPTLMTKHLSFRASGWVEFSYSVSSEAACWFTRWSHHHLCLPPSQDFTFEILPNNCADLIGMSCADE